MLAGAEGGVPAAAVRAAARPSSRYWGLNAIADSSPEKSAATVSLARAWPLVPASMVTLPGSNDSRTELPRSATSATRLTASASGTAGMSP